MFVLGNAETFVGSALFVLNDAGGVPTGLKRGKQRPALYGQCCQSAVVIGAQMEHGSILLGWIVPAVLPETPAWFLLGATLVPNLMPNLVL